MGHLTNPGSTVAGLAPGLERIRWREQPPLRAPALGYQIRRADDADRAQVEELLQEIFPRDDVSARYDWIHRGCPHGRSLVWLAVDEASGEVAALASYFPREIVLRGQRVRAVLGGDCWVRPRFRRRGIAGMLHAQGRDEMQDEAIVALFGTPTKANEGPLMQAGARNIGHLVRYARPLRVPGVALSSALLGRGWGQAELQPVGGADPRIDDLWRRTEPEIEIGVVRDAAYYAWRFLDAPARRQLPFLVTEHGQPIAACALERAGDYVEIIDLLAPRHAWGAALGAIVRWAGRHHADARALDLRLTEDDGRARRLWRWGLVERGRAVFNVLVAPDAPDAALLHDPARWFVTSADSDTDRST